MTRWCALARARQSVIDGMADGLAVLDPTGAVISWNAAASATGIAACDDHRAATRLPLGAAGEPAGSPTAEWPVDQVLSAPVRGSAETVVSFRDTSKGQGRRGGQRSLPRYEQSRAAHPDHRHPRLRLDPPTPLGRGLRSRPRASPRRHRDAHRRSSSPCPTTCCSAPGPVPRYSLTVAPCDVRPPLTMAVQGIRGISAMRTLLLDLPDDLPFVSSPTPRRSSPSPRSCWRTRSNTARAAARSVWWPASPATGSSSRCSTVGSASPPDKAGEIFARFYQAGSGDRREFDGIGLEPAHRPRAGRRPGRDSASGQPRGQRCHRQLHPRSPRDPPPPATQPRPAPASVDGAGWPLDGSSGARNAAVGAATGRSTMGIRSHRELGEADEHHVVVDPPSGESHPRHVVVGGDRQTGLSPSSTRTSSNSSREIEMGSSGAGLASWARKEEIGHPPQRRIARPQCGCAGTVSGRSGGDPQRRGVERGAGGYRPTNGPAGASGRGERGSDVCVSSISTNQSSQSARTSSSASTGRAPEAAQQSPGRWAGSRAHLELGHRRLAPGERAIERRKVRDQQSEGTSPTEASEKVTSNDGRPIGATSPSVSSDEPDAAFACARPTGHRGRIDQPSPPRPARSRPATG